MGAGGKTSLGELLKLVLSANELLVSWCDAFLPSFPSPDQLLVWKQGFVGS